MKNVRSYVIMLLVAVVLAATGCERRPLEIDYDLSAKVKVVCDWQYFSEVPTGMTMYFYRDGDKTPRIISTSEIYESYVNLPAGHWKMFLTNQSVYEFASYDFLSMDIYSEASVRLTEITSKWYNPVKAGLKRSFIGHNPEHLAVALASEFDITNEMVDNYQNAYSEYKTKLKSKATKSEIERYTTDLEENIYVIPVTSHDIISTVRVRIYINNIVSLRSARASLTGMAQGFILSQDITNSGDVDQLLESWKIIYDKANPTRGYIESEITTLGLPDGITSVENRKPTLNDLGFQLLLKDGNLLTYNFFVGDKFKITLDESGLGLRLNLYLQEGYDKDPKIELPDVVVDDGGGGFKADVTDWEEEINVGIPI